jgi:ABC-type antimicrobial peptide transport system permease subunit
MSPDAPIVGRSVRSHYDEDLPRTIVGVIPDLQYNGVSRARPRPIVLVPRAQSVRASMAFLVRTSSDPSDAIPAVRQAMTELDPDVALDALQPLRDAHASDLSGIRFLTTLFATFGVLALVLATSGVYGLISFSVAQRTREIGVRMAVGATRGSVRAAVLRESLALGVVGLTTGAGLAYAGGRALAAGMDGIAVLEASTFGGVALVLSGVVMAASWIPASRATRVDPVEALRSD